MLRKTLMTVFALITLGCASDVGNDGARVGGDCAVSSDCHLESRCLTGTAWPEGYCVQSCDSAAECPAGSDCAEEEGGICLVSCVANGECRDGYICAELPVRGGAGTTMGCVAP